MKKDKILVGLVVVDSILFILNVVDSIFGSMIRAFFSWVTSDVAAISIIGGADGPTSIFLAGKIGPPVDGLQIALIVAVVVTVAYVVVKKRKTGKED